MGIWRKFPPAAAACMTGRLLILLTLLPFGDLLPQSAVLARPASPWNSHAIEATFAGLRVHEIDASHSEVLFLYDLDNKTESDYQLDKGPKIMIMTRLKPTRSLSSEKQIALSASAFIPAGNRTRIALTVTRSFNWPARMDVASQGRIRQLVSSETAELDGFVLFDQASRYQIELPGSWPEVEKAP